MANKLKPLFKKFGFRSILKECKTQGWELPFAKDLKNQILEHDEVWVKDKPIKPEDYNSHAMVYKHSTGKTYLCNKNFMQNIIVIKNV